MAVLLWVCQYAGAELVQKPYDFRHDIYLRRSSSPSRLDCHGLFLCRISAVLVLALAQLRVAFLGVEL